MASRCKALIRLNSSKYTVENDGQKSCFVQPRAIAKHPQFFIGIANVYVKVS